MKTLKTVIRTLSISLVLSGIVFSFSACTEQSPFQPQSADSEMASSLAKGPGSGKGKGGGSANSGEQTSSGYPLSGTKTFVWDSEIDSYDGGSMQMNNGSMFHVYDASLTPRRGTGARKDVTLTMLVEKDEANNELIYTFGPSGTSFDPPAKIKLNWRDVSNQEPDLYYIDADGNYIKQQPDDVDKKGKNFILFVHHFSRYAVAWSR